MLPTYLFLKPPADVADKMDRTRLSRGIRSSYGRERFHSTIAPLGDASTLRSAHLDMMDSVIRSLDVKPFDLAFDYLRHRLLKGSEMRTYRTFQRTLVATLKRAGLQMPTYKFDPHISLTYGDAPAGFLSIPPIRWRVEELLLVTSIHGEGRHELIARWPLSPRQGSLDL